MSRICQEIEQHVQAFLSRPLQESGYAYVYLDATYLKGRLGKALQVCSRAVFVSMSVHADGRRELLGIKVGDRETEGFCGVGDGVHGQSPGLYMSPCVPLAGF